jgi:AcrR family transcriptional regulator
MRLFAEQGYESTTLPQIAEAAGVSRTTLLRYFPSKGAIIWHDVDGLNEAVAAALRAVPAERPWREALVELFTDVPVPPVEQLEISRFRMRLMHREAALRQQLAAFTQEGAKDVQAFIAERLGEPVDALRPAVLASAVNAALVTAWMWWALHTDEGDPREAIRAGLSTIGF